jgi:hypothetical protein
MRFIALKISEPPADGIEFLKTVNHLREDWTFLLEALFQIGQTLAKLVVIGHIIILQSLSAPAVIVRTIFIQDSRLCLHVENEPPHLLISEFQVLFNFRQ